MVSLLLFLCATGFSQKQEDEPEVKLVTHQVQLGETVRMISRKYFVAPSQIYKYNKFALEGITEGMLLYVPVQKNEIVTVEKVESSNKEPSNHNKTTLETKKNLKSPSVLSNKNTTVISSPDSTVVTHTVQNHETLYGLSKKYNITVDELKAQNPTELKKGLQVGQVLTIKRTN